MLRISVTSDIKEVRRRLSRWQRRALPEAIRNALNDGAFELRKYIVETLYPRSFPSAINKRFPGVAFRVEKASKTKLQAAVFDRLNRLLFPRHIEGKTKVPLSSSHLAVPVEARRTKGGKIVKSQQPRNLRNSFVHDFGKGPAIWQRKGGRKRKNQKLSLRFVLKRQTPQTANFPFFQQGEEFIRRRFPSIFDRELDKSLARLNRPRRR